MTLELYVHSCVYLQLNSSVDSFQSQNMRQARQCICLHHVQSQVLGLLHAELCWSTFNSMATRRSLTDWDITELVENQTRTHINWKTTFLLSDSDTVNANCWPIVPAVHSFTGGPSWLQKTEPPHVNKDPSPLSILTASFIHKPTKRLDTRDNRHWLMQFKRIWCHAVSAKHKERTT